jgi:hypothetical protein
MTTKVVRVHGERTCAVEVSPHEADAGGELTVVVRASCPDGCDLEGQPVSIRNGDGTELAAARLGTTELGAAEAVASEPAASEHAMSESEGAADTEIERNVYTTGAVTLQAPLDVGEHVWRAVLAAVETNGVLHEETEVAFSFTTQAHAASVNVWGVPSAIPVGESFGFKVGIKCSSGCNLAGRQVSILDHEGAQIAAGTLRDAPWPETSALYFAELRAKAPGETGDYHWRVETPESVTGVPHAAGSSTFAVKIVVPADHEVTVEAFDVESNAPIKGAHVLMHPYRALTDEKGVAKVRVAKGTYKLFVSGFNYIAYENVVDVANNIAIRAELAVEPEGREDYR